MKFINKWLIFGERSLTLIGAVFPDFESARLAKKMLEREPALDGEVALVGPDDPQWAKKFEPESAGIWRTALRSHAVLGALGVALGILCAFALAAAWEPAALSLGYAVLFLGVLGGFSGMLWAGLLTLRPDHGWVIRQLREALKRRRWTVVVRPLDEPRAELAMQCLSGAGAEPLRSF